MRIYRLVFSCLINTSVRVEDLQITMALISFIRAMWMTSIAVHCLSSSRTIYLARIAAYGGSYNASGMVPAEDLAIEHINNHSSILPGYTLAFTDLKKIDVCDLILPQNIARM